MVHYYTVYLAVTDEIVAFGSVAECAKQMGKSILGFHSLVGKNKLGKHHKYVIVIEMVRARALSRIKFPHEN